MNSADEWTPKATQWFIVTDLGLTTLSGNDGLHVMVRSLGSAGPVGGVRLRLVAVNNEVLGEATSDAEGYANFAPGLIRGTGGGAPGMLVAQTDAGDYSFLDLSKAAMDLTDRGVEGRDPPKPLDVFLKTERGIYRVGETVYATSLVRDATANAVIDVPLTAIVTRPDGKEDSRVTLQDQGLGGTVTPVNLSANAMRGTWRIGVYSDVKGQPLAETTFLVEDFEPERLDFDIETTVTSIDRNAPAPLTIDARFLYGAPAGNLNIEGEAVLKGARELAAYPGYAFGLAGETFDTAVEPFSGIATDEEGHAEIPVGLPDAAPTSLPLTADINVRVLDTSGRPVERTKTLPVADSSGRVGIRPLFDGAAAENGPAAFEVIALDKNGARSAAQNLDWSLYEVREDFQWYRTDGRWDYEIVETKNRVANGTIDISADRPARVEANVGWGTYRLEVTSATAAELPASYAFEAGWYVQAKALDTPEALKVSLDKELYRVGEKARVHLETRFNGVALIMIVDDRLIATKSVEVAGNAADIDIDVTRDWGPGAYVTAVLYRPMDIQAKRMPGRAIGLAWAGVDPADRDLQIVVDAPDEMRPRQNLEVGLTLANLPAGSEAYVTLAAVDLGILNLTRYETPDPESLLFRSAAARHVDPRSLQSADRPHARRARCGAYGRRRSSAADAGPAAHRKAGGVSFRHREGRAGREGTSLRSRTGLQRHAPPDGAGLDENGRRPRREGLARPRSGGGDGEPAELPRPRRHVAADARSHIGWRRERDCGALRPIGRNSRSGGAHLRPHAGRTRHG